MLKKTLLFGIAFFLGVLATLTFSVPHGSEFAMPTGYGLSSDVPSPKDRIPEEDIWLYRNKVVIMIDDPEWASFADTDSMDPVLDYGHNAIEIVPESIDEIDVGDIVSYKSNYADGTIIHRVIYKGLDDEGQYLVMKGDNNPEPDPERVREDQIQRVVVGLIF